MIGRYSFAQSIVSYFVLFSTLGTTMYGQRTIAMLKGDNEKRTRVFSQLFVLRCITTIIAVLVYSMTIVPNSVDPSLYLIAGIEIIQVGMDISWYFQGIEKFHIIALCSGGARIIAILLTVTLVRNQNDLSLYVLINCGTILLGFLTQWVFLHGNIDRKYMKLDGLSRGIHKPLVASIQLFVAQVAIQIYTVLDKTMIGIITKSEIQNGFYEQSQKLIRVLVAISTSISAVIASRIAVLYSKNQKSEIDNVLAYSFRFVFAIAIPMMVGIVLVAKDFVPLYYGPGYDEVIDLICILAPLPLIIGISNIIGIQYLVPTSQEKYLTLSVTVGSFVNFLLNIGLIKYFQAKGATIASIIAEVCVVIVQMYFVRKQIDLKKMIKLIIRYFLLCIPVILIGGGIQMFLAEGTKRFVITVVISVMVYGIELFLIKDPILNLSLIKKKEKQIL